MNCPICVSKYVRQNTNIRSPLDYLLKIFWEHVDNESMKMLSRTTNPYFRIDERGFTLPEVLITIVIMGILFAIASSTWFNVVESRAVDSAANQLAADMRLAHGSATNRLAKAQIVFNRDGSPVTCNGGSADYCLVQPTGSGGSRVVARTFSEDRARLHSPNIGVDPAGAVAIPGVLAGSNKVTIEFGSDGSARALGTVVGTPTVTTRLDSDASTADCATVHDEPCHDVSLNQATARVNID